MGILSKEFFKVREYLGKLSSFPQFPEISLLFASRNFFKFNGDVWSNKSIGSVAWKGQHISDSGQKVCREQVTANQDLSIYSPAPEQSGTVSKNLARTRYNDPSQGQNSGPSIESPKIMRIQVELRITKCGRLLQNATADHFLIHLNALVLNPYIFNSRLQRIKMKENFYDLTNHTYEISSF